MFSNLSQKTNDGLLESNSLSLMIARKGTPHTIGKDLILLSVNKVLDTVLYNETSSAVIKSIPLCNNTIQRRADDLATDIENRLCSIIKNTEFSFKLDKSTLPGNDVLLLAYVCFVCHGVLHEELGIFLSLNTDTQRRQYFRKSKYILKQSISTDQCHSVCN